MHHTFKGEIFLGYLCILRFVAFNNNSDEPGCHNLVSY